MVKLTLLAACNLFWFTASTILFTLIHNYIQKKAPAWQSILDLLLLDGTKVMIVHNTLITIMNYSGIFYGQLNPIIAEIFLGVATSFTVWIISMQEIAMIIKALIIFKPGVLADQPDHKVIGLFRRISIICTCVRFILDFCLPPRQELMLELLTGIEMTS